MLCRRVLITTLCALCVYGLTSSVVLAQVDPHSTNIKVSNLIDSNIENQGARATSNGARDQSKSRKVEEEMIKAQQAQAMYLEETQKLQQEQTRQSLEVAHIEQAKVKDAEDAERLKRETLRREHRLESQEEKSAENEFDPIKKKQKTIEIHANTQKINSKEIASGKTITNKIIETRKDEAEESFEVANREILSKAFFGSRKASNAEELAPLKVHPLGLQKAASQPYSINSANSEQRRQLSSFRDNLQSRLCVIQAADMPPSYDKDKQLSVSCFLDNYPVFADNQSLKINKKNTRLKDVAPTKYPDWYERVAGWTYCQGFIIGGSVQIDSSWLSWDWPAVLGPEPAGFLCRNDYIPTPWVYSPMRNLWRRAGEFSYREGPASTYTGPITVESIEPINAKIPDRWGVPVPQTINVLTFYNAFYNPEFDRWGYTNKQGNFVLLNI